MSGILCAEEKTKPDYISARVPSLLHALDLVVGHHLDSWYEFKIITSVYVQTMTVCRDNKREMTSFSKI